MSMKRVIATATVAAALVVPASAGLVSVTGAGDIISDTSTVGYKANFFNDTTAIVHG